MVIEEGKGVLLPNSKSPGLHVLHSHLIQLQTVLLFLLLWGWNGMDV